MMQICAEHWSKLRGAIDSRGLTALVADSGEKATANLLNESVEGWTVDNFDPLMAANNAIMSNALDASGGRALFESGCPICFCNANDPANASTKVHDYDVWIEMAADDVLTAWKSMGVA